MSYVPYIKDDIWEITVSHRMRGQVLKRTVNVTFTNAALPTPTQESAIIAKEASIAASSIIRERDEI